MFTFRLIAILTVFIAGAMSAILLSKIAVSRKSGKIFSLENTFAGGIFLGTGLVHMLPIAHDEFRVLTGNHQLPWVSIVATIGFFLALFIHKVLAYEQKAVFYLADGIKKSAFSPHILALSFSVHSIIIGVALGTENTFKKAFALLIAILIYKISAVFALEVNLHRSVSDKTKLRKLNTAFLGVTPLGITLGSTLTAARLWKLSQSPLAPWQPGHSFISLL